MSNILFLRPNARAPRRRASVVAHFALAGCVAVLTGCVTMIEFDTERHLLAFREAERSVVMVLLPDTLTRERVETNGVEGNVEGVRVPIAWPHAFEAELARNVRDGWQTLAPDLRLRASAPGGEYLTTRDLADCLAERDRTEKPWHEMESLSGLRYLDEPTRPRIAQKGVARRVEPDALTLLTSVAAGNDAKDVCHTLDLSRVRRNFDVDYAFVVEVASIRTRTEDGRPRTRISTHERLIALADGMIVREQRRESRDNDPSGLLGTALISPAQNSESDALFSALENASHRLPWLLARDFGDIDDDALVARRNEWASGFAAEVDRLRAAIAVPVR